MGGACKCTTCDGNLVTGREKDAQRGPRFARYCTTCADNAYAAGDRRYQKLMPNSGARAGEENQPWALLQNAGEAARRQERAATTAATAAATIRRQEEAAANAAAKAKAKAAKAAAKEAAKAANAAAVAAEHQAFLASCGTNGMTNGQCLEEILECHNAFLGANPGARAIVCCAMSSCDAFQAETWANARKISLGEGTKEPLGSAILGLESFHVTTSYDAARGLERSAIAAIGLDNLGNRKGGGAVDSLSPPKTGPVGWFALCSTGHSRRTSQSAAVL